MVHQLNENGCFASKHMSIETIQIFIQTLTKILQNLKYLTLFLVVIGT